MCHRTVLRAPLLPVNLKIKICGITNLSDALAAVDAGADALGFVFYEPSPRHVLARTAAGIIRRLPPLIAKVGVFVNAAESVVHQVVAECGLDTLQFHGEESPEFCRKFAPSKVIKAFRIRDADSLRALPAYETAAWLLDSYVPETVGGTGEKFNWDLACVAKEFGQPIILAGGLTPENVAEAVHEVWPYGVDVSSGVEATPGRKDAQLIRDFIGAVRGMENARF
ncbi:MAG: phosphoribosylanthranilate isomerase [Verrucomicrobia bacterium]|nr:phosphoribosylanthranilate isomerase [Verrucomicrobiota bacterium]